MNSTTPPPVIIATRDQITEALALLRDYVGPRRDVRTARCHIGLTTQELCVHCSRDLKAWKLLEEVGA